MKAAVGVGGNHIEVVGLLLDRGANPNKVIAFQNQLDHFVLAHCNIEVLRLLLDRGMDVSKVGSTYYYHYYCYYLLEYFGSLLSSRLISIRTLVRQDGVVWKGLAYCSTSVVALTLTKMLLLLFITHTKDILLVLLDMSVALH